MAHVNTLRTDSGPRATMPWGLVGKLWVCCHAEV